MKKKTKKNVKKKVLITVVTIIAIALILVLFIKRNEIFVRKPEVKESNFVYVGDFQDAVIDTDNYVFTSYNDFKSKFNTDTLTEYNFKNNNYVLISIMYDSCADDNIEPVNYKLEGNKLDVKVMYDASCGVCAPGYIYYLLKVDKSVTSVDLNVDYIARNKPDCDPNVTYKPMIYLYPEKEMDVTVKLGYENKLTTTYPKYNDGWAVKALPNGDLYDENGKYYYGLYWEGLNNLDVSFEDGFLVEKDNLIEFLEDKLIVLGLNEKERNEFIVYWLPILEQNKYNLIRFETLENIDNEMPLDISPKPDTVIRVLMEYKPVNTRVNIKAQELTTPLRKGFTVVEWGGTLIK